MSKYNFVHLHNHTEFSLLDGMLRVKEVVRKAKDLGMSALAITDHGNMHGAIDFYKECKANDIKPIIGSEFYVAPSSRFSKTNKIRYHLVLLAKSEIGYKNLMVLSSKSFTEGFYYKPRIDDELLEKYSEGLICLSACIQGEIPHLVLQGEVEKAEQKALHYKKLFGDGSFFLEIQMHGLKEEKIVTKALYTMSKKLKIPLVATNDAHYLNRDDAEAHDVLLCIGTKRQLSDTNRMRFYGQEFYFKSEEEMESIFKDIPKALSNTQFIANMCNVELDLPGPILPEFDVPEGYTKESYLRHLAEEGVKKRYSIITQEIKDRLEYELGVINRMKFPGYFLIVWDFVKFAKENNIWVGPGRGSGAGSIVAYALQITNIEPLEYGLLFERFLNEERVNMPDFDIDFCQERRQEVINYVNSKYSKEKVSQIVTFSKMKAKAVIKDVGRVLAIPYSEVAEIVKLLPDKVTSLSEEINKTEKLKQIYNDIDSVKRKLLDISLKLENLTRHTSVHAAGVVIGKQKITDYVPLQVIKDKKKGEMITTQFEGPKLEECGLVKMDFLGLITLTVMRHCVEMLEKRGITVDLDKIDFADPKVFELFTKGKTNAIFQFESDGMTKYLQQLKPTSIRDLIAMNALYRPGPIDFIDTYIKRKNGEENVEYDHPILEAILKETYGIMVYQEQVMQIARDVAGYSLGSADILRRAMGKKKKDVMKKHKRIFVEGAKKNGIDENTSTIIFGKMEKFAKYGFNKSHSTAYAFLAYQSAFLKAYYPVEFMASVLASEIKKPDKLLEYIFSIKKDGIAILPPDVNNSEILFSIESDVENDIKNNVEKNVEHKIENSKIRYAFAGIKGVGDAAAYNIVETRKKGGVFKSIRDFLKRVDLRVVNKAICETLIKCGAMDCLADSRKWLTENIDSLRSEAANDKEDMKKGQKNLFGELTESTNKEQEVRFVEDFSKKEKLIGEKEVLGFSVSGNFLEEYTEIINDLCDYNSMTVNEIGLNENGQYYKKHVKMAGVVNKLDLRKNNDGSVWILITFEDLFGNFIAKVNSKNWERYANLLNEHSTVLLGITVRKSKYRNGTTLEVTSVTNLENELSEFHIYLKNEVVQEDSFKFLKEEINMLNGNLSIFFHLRREGFNNDMVIKATNIFGSKDRSVCNVLQSKFNFIEKINIT